MLPSLRFASITTPPAATPNKNLHLTELKLHEAHFLWIKREASEELIIC